MKKISTLIIAFLFSANAFTQTYEYYVAYSTGVNMRKTPSLNADLLGKIPYATKLKLDYTKIDTIAVIVEGMTGYWAEVTYQNKKGYILNCYLTSVVPPKKGTKKMEDYLLQLSPKLGTIMKFKTGNQTNVSESGYNMEKQLYKNGCEWHKYYAWEYGSETHYLPQMNMQELFLIVRQIKEYEFVFSEKDDFTPVDTKRKKKNEIQESELNYRVIKNGMFITNIKVDYENGGYYNFEMMIIDGHGVVTFGSGI
jgi:uncharacterized protein YgiM (DUF1202 family)